MPLIFTETVLRQAERGVDPLSPLLLQWAALQGEQGARCRAQLERAAALVPEEQRDRILGPLKLGVDDEQVEAAADELLLAKTLRDHGWNIEFEDLLVSKADESYVVEVRTVRGRADEDRLQRRRVQRALAGITTKTPIHINAMDVPAGASMKAFRRHVLEVLAGERPGQYTYKAGGIYVQYELPEGADVDGETAAVFGWPLTVIYGNDSDGVAKAIHQKLQYYRFPIIVSLDLIDVLYGFEDVQKAFYGDRPIIRPLSSGRGASHDAHLGPAQGGLLVGRTRDAKRARERLVGLLPFSIGRNRETGEATVSARLFANPATNPPLRFAAFSPIPRMLAIKQGEESAVMSWDSAMAPSWTHSP